ncbi:MAG: gliding motility-associated C-terminal domain-containing protein [Bacteroidetes bacterium]|nr:gliding motility-associated C-terminal domain-containing protein [Bacteroidota bacterium]
MKKFLLFFVLLFFVFSGTFAAHIIGGELRYEYLGPGTTPNTRSYKIILLLIKGDATGPNVAQLAASYVVGIFNNDNNQMIPGDQPDPNGNGHLLWLMTRDEPPGIQAMPIIASPCLVNQPTLAYTYATYSMTIELPLNNNGYTIAHQTCCRQANMMNVVDNMGANYSCVIPRLNQLPASNSVDSSPKYHLPISVICFNSPFTMDFAADDMDGDSLVYSFCDAYNGGLAQNSGYNDAEPPPYGAVTYQNGYTSSAPLGNLATINPQTGIISGIAPDAGNYVVCVCVQAWRNGRLITTHRKDLLVRVSPCIPTVANPDPGYTTCDGFTIQFNHNSTGANSVFWDFGVPSVTNDTANIDNPVFTYPDTGIYYVKFYINKDGNCTDSATIQMGIYPGFFPGFKADAPYCAGQPIQFNDTTITNYGAVDSWSWNFGNTATLADTSHLQAPQYTYPSAGTYHASFIVTNSKGCIDTVYKDITVNPLPAVTAPPDTLYCGLDSLQLTATGTSGGTYAWTPNTNILGANNASVTVFPSLPTTYYSTITVAGCSKTDSVRLTPAFDLTNNITASPPSICQEDTLTLTGTTNHTTHISWQWSPVASLSAPTSSTTQAYPNVTTAYTLQTKWGDHCVATKNININVTPLAIPNAGANSYICAGQTSTTLSASGGNTYNWSPATGLSNPNIPNPVASPSVTTNYIVHVGVNGCAKTKADTVTVEVKPIPPLTATNDTLICIVDGLQLNANGTGNMHWTPNYNINNQGIANPFVTPTVDTTYYIHIVDNFGCFNNDSVMVRVKPKTVVDAGNDTTICKTESFHLNTTGDALHYQWFPATFLSSDTAMQPLTTPLTDITYQVIGNIGTCSDTSYITIHPVPYPAANAGPDSTVCFGFNAQLFASGGSHFTWTPGTYLSNISSANPIVANPLETITYTVTVTDTLGCPKPITSTATVTVIPQLHVSAGADSSIVQGQPLQLQGSGAEHYLWAWSPANFPGWLTNQSIWNPVASPQDNITYILTGTDNHGCRAVDSVMVLVYTIEPSMYVPTAFTPNGDNLNDNVKPIMLGMKSLKYFRIYNRFGELVFETQQQGKGWDGYYKGKPQDSATFVWMAQGETYKGQTITKKGFVVLIR